MLLWVVFALIPSSLIDLIVTVVSATSDCATSSAAAAIATYAIGAEADSVATIRASVLASDGADSVVASSIVTNTDRVVAVAVINVTLAPANAAAAAAATLTTASATGD